MNEFPLPMVAGPNQNWEANDSTQDIALLIQIPLHIIQRNEHPAHLESVILRAMIDRHDAILDYKAAKFEDRVDVSPAQRFVTMSGVAITASWPATELEKPDYTEPVQTIDINDAIQLTDAEIDAVLASDEDKRFVKQERDIALDKAHKELSDEA